MGKYWTRADVVSPVNCSEVFEYSYVVHGQAQILERERERERWGRSVAGGWLGKGAGRSKG